LEEHAEQILAFIGEQPDLTLREIVISSSVSNPMARRPGAVLLPFVERISGEIVGLSRPAAAGARSC
jgi:hypothetical protein